MGISFTKNQKDACSEISEMLLKIHLFKHLNIFPDEAPSHVLY